MSSHAAQKPPRVLVWGINYAPEAAGIAPYNVALCEHLHATGHEVHMLTSFAYYPEWKKLAADEGKLFRTDDVRGVPVHRCWHYVPQKVSPLRRIVHEGTFVLISFLRGLTLPRPDVIFVASPPLLLGAAAWVLGKLRRAPYIFHVQDLQPDAAVGLGMLKPSKFTRILYLLEALAYAKAARVSGISHGILRAFRDKGVPPDKQVYFPNGFRTPDLAGLPARGRWRARQGFAPDDFLAVYGGNLGVKQGLEILIEAAALLQEKRVRLVICGHGAAQERIQAEIERRRPPNLTLLPMHYDEEFREMMVDTDLCLITQQTGTGQYFFPSKLLSALAFARPVLAVADDDNELALVLKDGGFGVRTTPDQPVELASELDRLARLDAGKLRQMGEAGRRFGEQFAFGKVLPDFEKVLREVGDGRAGAPPALQPELQ